MNKRAYDVGFALGIVKSGSVARVEGQNARLVKLATLLKKKGFSKLAAIDLGSWAPSWGRDLSSKERQEQIRSKVGERAKHLGPLAEESAGQLKRYAGGGKIKMPTAKVTTKADKGAGKEPLELEPETAKTLKQQGAPGAGGPSDDEAGFYGGPQFGNVKKYWMQLLGMSPSQLSAQQTAREAGYGRALRHKTNLDWLKSVLLGPQAGHYGMGM